MSDDFTLSSNVSHSVMSMTLSAKVDRAIGIIQRFFGQAMAASDDGYWLAFSGGKDSIVIKELAKMAGVKFRSVYNVTTIDPPELVRFIKAHHSDVEWNRPKVPFFVQLPRESCGPPTRHGRWCCKKYKEHGGIDHVKILGVRALESPRRASDWDEVAPSRKGQHVILAPIFFWSDAEVWQFIRMRELPYCSLYDEGFKRLGCVGCPLAGEAGIRKDFARWPRYEKLWRNAIAKQYHRWVDVPMKSGKPRFLKRFKDADQYFEWWITGVTPEDEEACAPQGELFQLSAVGGAHE